jgi:DNA-binding response OmpR family regulator
VTGPVLTLGSGPWLSAWLSGVLQAAGIPTLKVLCAADLDAGATFDSAVIDLALPDMAGWQLLEELAGEVDVVVLLSSETSDAERALALGAKAFIARPIDPARLVAVVRHLDYRLTEPPAEAFA